MSCQAFLHILSLTRSQTLLLLYPTALRICRSYGYATAEIARIIYHGVDEKRLGGPEGGLRNGNAGQEVLQTLAVSLDQTGGHTWHPDKGCWRWLVRSSPCNVLGLLLKVVVTAANVPERAGGKQLLAAAFAQGLAELVLIWGGCGLQRPR